MSQDYQELQVPHKLRNISYIIILAFIGKDRATNKVNSSDDEVDEIDIVNTTNPRSSD